MAQDDGFDRRLDSARLHGLPDIAAREPVERSESVRNSASGRRRLAGSRQESLPPDESGSPSGQADRQRGGLHEVDGGLSGKLNRLSIAGGSQLPKFLVHPAKCRENSVDLRKIPS